MLDGVEPPALIMVGHEDFSSGVVGLIASKLVTIFGRPAIAYERGSTQSRASCRSIEEFHITDALRAHPSLFVRFGGHRQAAGFTAENIRLDEIRASLEREAEIALRGIELAPVLWIDCQLPLRALRGEEIRWLSRIGPFGIGNPEPAFLARELTVMDVKPVGDGERHVRLRLRDGGATWPAIAFDMADACVEAGTRVDVVYTLRGSGRSDGTLEIEVKDMRPTGVGI
jgi:single-stranded-DNA-specific exonuclease